jgi:hypothetical protein
MKTELEIDVDSTWKHDLNSMELSHFLKDASLLATQEFLNILRNPKVHYRVYKSCPLALIQSHINP